MLNLFTNKIITYTSSVHDSRPLSLSDKFYGVHSLLLQIIGIFNRSALLLWFSCVLMNATESTLKR